MAQRRVMKDLTTLQQTPIEGVSAEPIGNDVFNWNGFINGPIDTPYDGGVFKVKIAFPNDYPFTAPKLSFATPIYHPNVNSDGKVCLSILDKEWNPSVNISQVLMTVQLLLKEPNPESAVLPSIGKQYEDDREAFNKEARKQTEEHATTKQQEEEKNKKTAEENNNNTQQKEVEEKVESEQKTNGDDSSEEKTNNVK